MATHKLRIVVEKFDLKTNQLERLVQLATKIKGMLLKNSGLNQFEHAIY